MATMNISLDIHDEAELIKIYVDAIDTARALDDFRHFLRMREKHVTLSEDAYHELALITDKLNEILSN